MSPMLSAALAYATRGWPVLPLSWPIVTGERPRCACGSASCRSAGKHPYAPLVPNGLKDATTDAEQVRAWWTRAPLANVGLVLGERTGLFAIDVDPRHKGDRTLIGWILEGRPFPITLHAHTGSGGDHYLFKWPGRPVRNSAGRLGPGLDVKGDGGYIVAPPSLHPNGERYGWENPDAAPVDAPTWLLEVLLAPERPQAAEPAPLPSNPRGLRLPTLTDHQALNVLVRECAFIEHAIHSASTLSYNEWFSLATVLHPFSAGDELFDEISSRDPLRYREREARKKTASIRGKPRHCSSLGWSCPRLGECARLDVRSPAGLPYKLMKARKGAA